MARHFFAGVIAAALVASAGSASAQNYGGSQGD